MLGIAIEVLKAAALALVGSFFLVVVLSASFLPSEFHGVDESGQPYFWWSGFSFLPAIRELLPAYGIAFFAVGIAVGFSRDTRAATCGCFAVGVLYAVHFGADLLELLDLFNENRSRMTSEARQLLDAAVRDSLIAIGEALFLMPFGAVVIAFVRGRLRGQMGEQK